MVPKVGLEPTSNGAEVFETSVYTIPPLGQIIMAARVGVEPTLIAYTMLSRSTC